LITGAKGQAGIIIGVVAVHDGIPGFFDKVGDQFNISRRYGSKTAHIGKPFFFTSFFECGDQPVAQRQIGQPLAGAPVVAVVGHPGDMVFFRQFVAKRKQHVGLAGGGDAFDAGVLF